MELPVTKGREDDELAGLVSRARSGSARAFDELARRVRDRVRLWARHVTQDEDDAEDVAQLVLLRLHTRVTRFDGRSRFTTWLYRVTRNVALNRRRSDGRRSALLAATPLAVVDVAQPATTEVDALAPRLAELVRMYYAELPSRQREVFELADVGGLTSSEIGERLGIAPSTVRVVLHQARRAIRLRMLEHHARLLEEYEP